jgi:hypothetical protein
MATQDKQHRNNSSLTRTLCSRAKEKRHGVIRDAIPDMAMQGVLASGSSIHIHGNNFNVCE